MEVPNTGYNPRLEVPDTRYTQNNNMQQYGTPVWDMPKYIPPTRFDK